MTDEEKIKQIKEALQTELGISCLNCYKSTGTMTRDSFDRFLVDDLTIEEVCDNLYCFIRLTEKIVKIIYKDGEDINDKS